MLRTSALVAGIIVLAFIGSCSTESDPGVNQLSEYARNYIGLYTGGGAMSAMSSNFGIGNPAAESFQRLSSGRSGGIFGGRTMGDSTETPESDTTIYDYPYQSCATVSIYQNEDGSTTTVYDYGDGCLEGQFPYQYLMFGKFGYTNHSARSTEGSVITDHYSYSSFQENYGGHYYYDEDTTEWVSNGTSDYTGESEYDSVSGDYSGWNTYNHESDYAYDTITYTSVGTGKSRYSNSKYIQEENDYSYSYGDNYYHVKVIEPLVMDYSCNPFGDGDLGLYRCFFWVYVSGREQVFYRQDGHEGSFIVDYGDGKCDTKITVIENDVQVAVDLYQ